MSAAQGASAWSIFWEEQGASGGCLITGDLQRPLLSQWLSFAPQLPSRARVIDLGCGAATVGRALLDCRQDLRIVGVDAAVVPAQSRPGLETISSVRMEALPFEDSSFHAAVSQFAVEYSDIRGTARELQRVLKPGGSFCFLVHHSDSEIARDGRMRRQALRAMVTGPVRSSFLSGKPERHRQEMDRLIRTYPRERLLRLARDYFARRISGNAAERERVVRSTLELMSPDVSMLSQLERSTLSTARVGNWLVPLIERMSETAVSVVRTGGGEPISWKIHGRR